MHQVCVRINIIKMESAAGLFIGSTKCVHRNHRLYSYIYTYIYTYIHTYLHPSIHTYILTYMHAYIHAYIHTYIHTYLHTCIHTYTHTYIHTYIHTYTYSQSTQFGDLVSTSNIASDPCIRVTNSGALLWTMEWTPPPFTSLV